MDIKHDMNIKDEPLEMIDKYFLNEDDLNYEVKHQGQKFFNTSSIIDLDLENYSCVYSLGDLVWVKVKGSPLWPGMITYSQNENNFAKFKYTSTVKKRSPRLYHVQFFGDNHRTMWISSKSSFIYEGLDSLPSYFERLELVIKSGNSQSHSAEKNLLKSFSQMRSLLTSTANNSKSLMWYQAVKEANQAMTMERSRRIFHYAPNVELQKTDQQYNQSTLMDNIMWETYSFTSESSEDFLGFEEDSLHPKGIQIKLTQECYKDFWNTSELEFKSDIDLKDPLEIGDEDYILARDGDYDSVRHQELKDFRFDEETLFRKLKNSEFPKVVVQKLNIGLFKKNSENIKIGSNQNHERIQKIASSSSNCSKVECLNQTNHYFRNRRIIIKRNEETEDSFSHQEIKSKKRFRCFICNFQSNLVRNLKQHLLTHAKKKLFECSECGFKCNFKGNLTNHLMTHSNLKLFKCSKCSFRCSEKKNFERHILIHSEVIWFKCLECDFKSKFKSDFKKHLLKH